MRILHPSSRAGLVAAMLAVSAIAPLAAQESVLEKAVQDTADPPLAAQESALVTAAQDAADPPRDTVVAQFHLPQGALSEATDSKELIAALREQLTIDLAMPLDEPLRVSLRGWAGAEGGDFPAYSFTLGSLGVSYSGEGPLDDLSYALAVRESHGEDSLSDRDEWDELDADDWDEDEAWSSLVEALDAGLPQSAPGFQRPGPGEHVALQVVEVHTHDFALAARDSGWGEYGWCCLEKYEGAVLQIQPDISVYALEMNAGKELVDGLFHRRNILVIELEPGVTEATPATGATSGARGADPAAADTEALEMAEQLQGACATPQLVSAASSTSRLVLDGDALVGHAAIATDRDKNRILKLHGEAPGDPWCLILLGRGGPSKPGRYEVIHLSMALMDQSQSQTDPERSRFVASLFGGPDGETLFVAESGFVEIESVEPEFRGRFELEGWTAVDGVRTDDATLSGSFNATDPTTAGRAVAASAIESAIDRVATESDSADAGAGRGTARLPEGFPADFPLPPEFNITSGQFTDDGNQTYQGKFLVRGTSASSVSEITTFYLDRLAQAGYKHVTPFQPIVPEMIETLIFFSGDDFQNCSVRLVRANGSTTVTIDLPIKDVN